MKVDLHLHSTCSDGELFPEQIVESEVKAGLDVIALTDHDNVDGVSRAKREAQKYDIKLLAGIELSAFCNGKETHILVYGMDYQAAEFAETLIKIQSLREERNKKIIARLADFSVNIDYELLKQKYNGTVWGRSQIAKEIVAMGVCVSVPEAFDRFLSQGSCAYVDSQRLSVEKAIELAKKFNGVAVLAHPAKLRHTSAESENFVKYLLSLGLGGIEAAYFSHTNVERDYFLYLAKKYDIPIFGGSDFHSESYGVSLGTYFEPDKRTEELIERLLV